MSTRGRHLLIGLATALAISMGVGGCRSAPTTTVVIPGQSTVDDTATLTPLERGELRRLILSDIEEAIKAWTSGDVDAVESSFSPAWTAEFVERWDGYAAEGQQLVHDHELIALDVVEMDESGRQALAAYEFVDHSYVVDESGAVVEPPSDFPANVQITAEPDDTGTWRIVRMIGDASVLR